MHDAARRIVLPVTDTTSGNQQDALAEIGRHREAGVRGDQPQSMGFGRAAESSMCSVARRRWPRRCTSNCRRGGQTDEVSRLGVLIAADALGRTDEAIAYAIESVERCDNTGPYWTRAPFFSDALRAHPRYPELLPAIGL